MAANTLFRPPASSSNYRSHRASSGTLLLYRAQETGICFLQRMILCALLFVELLFPSCIGHVRVQNCSHAHVGFGDCDIHAGVLLVLFCACARAVFMSERERRIMTFDFF